MVRYWWQIGSCFSAQNMHIQSFVTLLGTCASLGLSWLWKLLFGIHGRIRPDCLGSSLLGSQHMKSVFIEDEVVSNATSVVSISHRRVSWSTLGLASWLRTRDTYRVEVLLRQFLLMHFHRSSIFVLGPNSSLCHDVAGTIVVLHRHSHWAHRRFAFIVGKLRLSIVSFVHRRVDTIVKGLLLAVGIDRAMVLSIRHRVFICE